MFTAPVKGFRQGRDPLLSNVTIFPVKYFTINALTLLQVPSIIKASGMVNKIMMFHIDCRRFSLFFLPQVVKKITKLHWLLK